MVGEPLQVADHLLGAAGQRGPRAVCRAPGDESRSEGVEPERGQIAAHALRFPDRRLTQRAEASGIGVRVEKHRIQPVAGPCGPARPDLRDGAEDDRRMRLLQRLRLERDVGDLVEAAVPVQPGLRPRVLPDLDALLGDGSALLEVGAERRELLGVPARPGAHDQAAAGEDVERRELVRDRERMTVRRDQDRRRQTHPCRHGRESADSRHDVEHRRALRIGALPGLVRRVPGAEVTAHAHVVGEPEGVVAEALGELRELDHAHLRRLELLQEEVAPVAGQQAVRRHRQAHVHEAGRVYP